jgi:hypothetical protein
MRLKICVQLFLVLLPAINAPADTYYVKNGGNDSADGLSDATAWASLYKASVSLSDGDEVLLKRGDTWPVTHNKRDSQAAGMGLWVQVDNVTVGSYGTGNNPIIDASAQTDVDDSRLTQAYSPVEVGVRYGHASRGIIIQDLDLRGPALGMGMQAYSAGPSLEILRCDFQGAGWSSETLLSAGSAGIVVEDCFFDQLSGNSEGYSKSIEIRGGSEHIIRGSVFYGYRSGGALRFSNHGTGAVIEGNYFYHPDTRSGADWAWAMVIRSADGGTYIVRNNVIDMTNPGPHSGSNLRGIAVWGDSAATTRKYFNNVFIGDGAGYGIHSGGAANIAHNNIFYNLQAGWNNIVDGTILRNNIFYACNNKFVDGIPDEEGSGITDPNLANPSMSNATAFDTEIQLPSDAIDAGLNSDPDAPVLDFEGNARPFGSAIDIGAFEYGASPPDDDPPPGEDQPPGTNDGGDSSSGCFVNTLR